MKACLKNGDVLVKIITAIREVASDVNVECSPTGMSLQAMDSSHVSLVSMLLRSEGFEPWELEETCQLGINLEYLFRLLRCMRAKDSVEMIYRNGQELDFVFKDLAEEHVSHFSLRLMEIDADHLGIPDTEYGTSVRMSSAEFMRICRDLSFGDTMTIKVTKEEISFSAEGELGSGTMSLKNSTATGDEESTATLIDSSEDISLSFALRYLQSYTKATPLSKVVVLRMSAAVPLLVEYKIDELGYIRYYLAAKIEEEMRNENSGDIEQE